MAITNITGDPKPKSMEDFCCSPEITEGMHNQLIFLSVINSFLSFSAFWGNSLILVALHKVSSLHPPSKLLFRNLAITDLCAGIIVDPLFVTYFISIMINWNICRHLFVILKITASMLAAASLFTLTEISVDRLLALLLRLRYRQFVTLKRTFLIVTLSWIVSIFGPLMSLWSDPLILWYGGSTEISLCVVASVFSYAKIFLTLRHNHVQAQQHLNQGLSRQTTSLNVVRYRKTVSTTLWVQLALVICYLPYAIALILSLGRGLSSSIFVARLFTATLVFLNSTLNPILYCWKIREVREAVKDIIRQLFCLTN